MASRKDSDDGEEVFGELILGGIGGSTLVIVHDDRCSVTLKYPLEELEGKPAKSVTVGHMYSPKSAGETELQNGSEPLAVEVETASNVGDDAAFGVSLLHEGDLVVEVPSLGRGGDSAVDDVFSCSNIFFGWWVDEQGSGNIRVAPFHQGTKAYNGVLSMVARGPDGVDGAIVGELS